MSLLLVEATLGSPVVVRDELHLDGLLMAAHPLARETPIARTDSLDALPAIPLPLQRLTLRGFRLPLATVAIWPEEARLGTDHTVRRRDGVDIEMLASPINLGLGPGKNRMQRLPIVIAPRVSWYAMGRRREVLRLVQRITHLGAWRSAGYGQVHAWTVTTLHPEQHDPTSVVRREGVAMRPLPRSWCADATTVHAAALEPPYWHPGRIVPDVVPAGTPITLTRELMEACYAAADPAKNDRWRMRRDQERRARRAGTDGAGAPEGG